jgi:hypothetical protein
LISGLIWPDLDPIVFVAITYCGDMIAHIQLDGRTILPKGARAGLWHSRSSRVLDEIKFERSQVGVPAAVTAVTKYPRGMVLWARTVERRNESKRPPTRGRSSQRRNVQRAGGREGAAPSSESGDRDRHRSHHVRRLEGDRLACARRCGSVRQADNFALDALRAIDLACTGARPLSASARLSPSQPTRSPCYCRPPS